MTDFDSQRDSQRRPRFAARIIYNSVNLSPIWVRFFLFCSEWIMVRFWRRFVSNLFFFYYFVQNESCYVSGADLCQICFFLLFCSEWIKLRFWCHTMYIISLRISPAWNHQ